VGRVIVRSVLLAAMALAALAVSNAASSPAGVRVFAGQPGRTAAPATVGGLARSCGATRVAGRTWRVTVKSLGCAAARRIVHRLATRAVPLSGLYSGTYAERCSGKPTGARPKQISCVGISPARILLAK
jgi:hypothetical protein